MAGATIDHMVSVTILIAALMIAMLTYSSMFATAVEYDSNRQVANKAIDLMNTMCLSPGNPTNWGTTDTSLLGFGLNDPNVGGYSLSPYSIMRLATSNSSGGSSLVYYPKTGLYYNNLSADYGHGVFAPTGDLVNYTTVAQLLGIDGTYGFGFHIAPTIDVDVTLATGYGHLALNVEVTGSGLPLSDATLNYHLFHVNELAVIPISGVTQTDPSGQTVIEFETIDEGDAFSFTVYANVGGINGVGYYTRNTAGSDLQFVIPLVTNYTSGEVILAHAWDIFEDDSLHAAVQINATFFILTSGFQFQEFDLEFTEQLLNYGEGKPYYTTQLPVSEVGLLVISYQKSTNEVGTIIMPWGIGTLGVSASFDSGIGSGGYAFVATELRQVTIDGISYMVKVSTWKLGS